MNQAQSSGWHKSSYSASSGNCVEVATGWRKSSYSDANGACVEVAAAEHIIAVRDTKQNSRGPILEFTADAWRDFIAAAKSGKLDLEVG